MEQTSMIMPHLREEIEQKRAKIMDILREKNDNKTKAFEERKRMVTKALNELGDVYTFWIEHPDLRKDYLTHNLSEETVKKKARESIRAIKNAGNILYDTLYGKFTEFLTPSLLMKVNALINEKPANKGTFRTRDVSLGTAGYTPLSWEHVPWAVDEIIKNTKEKYAKDPLEAGIYFHIESLYTQPFMEGNKRTARLVQDRIFYDADLPPAIIPAGEGKFYLDLIKRTAPAFRDGNLDGQKQFYDFVASKVNNGLDEILNDLKV